MSDTNSPRSYVDRNVASEQEDPVLHDPSSNEHEFFGEPWFTEPAADNAPPYARLGGTYGLNYNNWSDFFPEAGPASMDAGFSPVNVPDQQTVNPSWIQAGNWDSTGVSMQPENLEPLRDTGFYLTEPLGDAFFTAFDLGATGFTYDEGAPVSTYPNTVDPEGYGDVELSHDTMIEQAKSNDFERDGNNFPCNICGKTFTRPDNLKRHQKTVMPCKTVWEHQGKAALGGSRT